MYTYVTSYNKIKYYISAIVMLFYIILNLSTDYYTIYY